MITESPLVITSDLALLNPLNDSESLAELVSLLISWRNSKIKFV